MFGVILFVLILLIYGLVLSRKIISNLVTTNNAEQAEQTGFARFMNNVNHLFENKGVLFILSVIGIVVGVWNFFAPDFSAVYSPPVLGALIPSLILIIDAAVIYPSIVEILNLNQEQKDKYYETIGKIADIMGIVTLIAGFLHIALFNAILF